MLEGFENPEKSMCVGMQWHPEANATGNISKMFKTLTDYAKFKKGNNDVGFMEWAATQSRGK